MVEVRMTLWVKSSEKYTTDKKMKIRALQAHNTTISVAKETEPSRPIPMYNVNVGLYKKIAA